MAFRLAGITSAAAAAKTMAPAATSPKRRDGRGIWMLMVAVAILGVGFALVVTPEGVDRVSAALADAGLRAHVLGRAVDDPERTIHFRPRRLVGRGGRFMRA